jgi:phenylalanyl-tRNA synthetase alpha chain
MGIKSGHLHPSTLTLRNLVKIFEELGFEVFEGPEVDDEWHNFDALNVPADHPARDVQDTFWLKDNRVMRTHTSNCQIRSVKDRGAPLRVVIPGKCYRNEATDESHESTLWQFEGLYIDKNVTVANLFWTIENALKKLYGDKVEYRIVPHHYPFVEPGYDFYVKAYSSVIASAGDCPHRGLSPERGNLERQNGGKWIEMLGSGMVHPIVLKNMGLNPDEWSGFAFGMGPDRMTMRKYGIRDIRQMWGNDLRFLKQF